MAPADPQTPMEPLETVVRVVDLAGWQTALQTHAELGGRLLSLWACTPSTGQPRVHAALLGSDALSVLALDLPDTHAVFPSAAEHYPFAARMERAIFDLNGLRSSISDTRAWLRHAAWPSSAFPLRADAMPAAPAEPEADAYPFVRVSGDGVHEIAVGPVHAGIIEPGHFRFSVVGEKVLRLEQHLGYVHKGIERRFTELAAIDAHRLAARISGDSAVAYSWAYCRALESCAHHQIPERAAWLRALSLELERISNHLGDLGALGNDAGFGFALAQFSRLKERVLRLIASTLGQRYLLDYVVPGGVAVDPTPAALDALAGAMTPLVAEITRLHTILDEHAGVRDRFSGAGIVSPDLARVLGLTGFAGRASGQAFDLRVDLPCPPYAALQPRKAGASGGDVAARAAVRFEELLDACRMVGAIARQLPDGAHRAELPPIPDDAFAIGCTEGWRGPVMIALHTAPAGRIARCHAHDPSWQNWPVLEHAIIGNIVPDFPLINKSFNLSYSGHDL